MEKKSFKLCHYPKNGFGGKNGQPYLIDQFGNKYEFELDNTPDTANRDWSITIGTISMSGDSPSEIVEELKTTFGFDIKKW